MQLFPGAEQYTTYSCSIIPPCSFMPLQFHMANIRGLHNHAETTSTADYVLLVEGVLWVNSQSQPTSALLEKSTIFLLYTHRLYKWRSQLHSMQGEGERRERDCSDHTGLNWVYLHTSPLLRNTDTQTWKVTCQIIDITCSWFPRDVWDEHNTGNYNYFDIYNF